MFIGNRGSITLSFPAVLTYFPFRSRTVRLLSTTVFTSLMWISFMNGAQRPLVETGSFAKEEIVSPETVKIVSYNVHGPLTEDVEAVFAVLKENDKLRSAHVWALQEVRTSLDRNFARDIAQRLGMDYAHAIARPRGGGWEGLSFLSRLPISNAERLELPHLDTGERRRIGLFVTVTVGDQQIRICNVHLPIKMNHQKREEQFRLILEQFNLNSTPTRQIILGDFNTITGGLRRLYHTILETSGFRTPFEGHTKTYQRYFFLRFKLDWIYLRGLKVLDFGIEQEVKASDHRPVWVDVR
jgi:endonuclease/exonuclease/phosphatase family metal-dependent hydrolase